MYSDEKAGIICKKVETLKADRVNWETYWEAISQFVLPNRSEYIGKRTKGDLTRSNQIYDSTAVRSARLLGRSIQGAVISSSFFGLKIRNDREQTDNDAVNKWLEQCSSIMLAAFEDSNFQVQAGQAIHNNVVFGTAALTVEGRSNDLAFDGLVFRDESLSDFVFDEDANGMPAMVYRQVMLSPDAAYLKYKDVEGVPKEVIEDLEKKKSQTGPKKVEFIESIEPIGLHAEDNHSETTTVNGENVTQDKGAFVSYMVYKPLKKIVSQQYFQEMPTLVFRWDKITGDQYGWSEAMTALPDIITLNEIKRLELGAVEKAILPPKEIPVGVLTSGSLNRAPNGITMVNKPGQISNIDEPYNFTLTANKTDELQYSIKSCFHEQDLVLPDRANDTATEVRIRYELMQRLLGSTFGRMTSEFLNPLINRVFRIMFEGGAFPDQPQIEGFEGAEIDVEYQSPLARSQRQDDVTAASQVLGIQQQIAAQYPEIQLALDPYEVLKTVNNATGAPSTILIDRAKYDEKVKEAKAQQQAMAQEQRQHEVALKTGGQNGAQ